MLRRLGRSRATRDDGFSLLEVIISLALFMIMSASMGLALTQVLSTSRSNESRVIAANLVARKIETFRGMDAQSIALGDHAQETVMVEGKPYRLDVNTQLDTVGGSGSACSGSSGAASFKHVHVTGSWERMDGVDPVRSDTTLALPITGATPTAGVLTIPVEDAAGNPVPNMQVTVSAPSRPNVTASTQADGCAVFNGLPASSSYTASVNQTGWVDPEGNELSQKTPIEVVAGNVNKAAGFVYDKAAGLRLNVNRAAGAGTEYTFPSGLGVTLANSASTFGVVPYGVCGTQPCVTAPGPDVRESNQLFPYDDGYRAWIGQCSTAEPSVSDPIEVESGQMTTAATQPAAALRFSVVDSGGVAQAGWDLKVMNIDCPTEEFVLGQSTTDSVALSLPAGRWRIETSQMRRSWWGSYYRVTRTEDVTLNENQVLNSGTPVQVRV